MVVVGGGGCCWWWGEADREVVVWGRGVDRGPADEWQEGEMQEGGGKYSKRVKRIHVRRFDWQRWWVGGMKGTRMGKVMEREKRMEEGSRKIL